MGAQTIDDAHAAAFAAAQELGPMIRACADETERDRELPAPLVEALAAAGLFKLSVPRILGGAEADPATIVRIIEEVARADGSTGWCLMLAIQTGIFTANLPPADAREIFADPRAFVAGVGGPAGRAGGGRGGRSGPAPR